MSDEDITLVGPLAGAPPWLTLGLAEIGVHELSGPAANPRIVEYHSVTTLHATSDETPWCASFVCWCLERSGVPSPRSARATDLIEWGIDAPAVNGIPPVGTVVVLYTPQPHESTHSGYHVGLLCRMGPRGVFLLSGNSANQVRVSFYSFEKWRIKGARWPRGISA